MPLSREDVLDAAQAAGLSGAELDAFMAEEGFAAPEPKPAAKPVERVVARAAPKAPAAPKASVVAVVAPTSSPVVDRAVSRMTGPTVMTSTYAEKVPAVEVVARGAGRTANVVDKFGNALGSISPTKILGDVYGSLGKMDAGMDRAQGRLDAREAPREAQAVQAADAAAASFRRGYSDTRKVAPKPPAEPMDLRTEDDRNAAAEALGMPAPARPVEVVVRPPPAKAQANNDAANTRAAPAQLGAINTPDDAIGYLVSQGYTMAEITKMPPARLILAAKALRAKQP